MASGAALLARQLAHGSSDSWIRHQEEEKKYVFNLVAQVGLARAGLSQVAKQLMQCFKTFLGEPSVSVPAIPFHYLGSVSIDAVQAVWHRGPGEHLQLQSVGLLAELV